jgi:hypothetical protein
VPVPGSGKQTTPQRKVFEGQEFLSIQAAASILNRTPRTLRRLESEGIIPRPTHELPGSKIGMRWYTQADLEQLQRVVAQSGFAEQAQGTKGRLKSLLATVRTERGPQRKERPQQSSWSGEHVSRRPRELLRRGDDDDDEWMPPGSGSTRPERQVAPIPPPETCPRCKAEILWVTQPGNGQVPVCERCGAIDLRPPEPADPNRCARCGQEVVWEMSGQPVCDSCGLVEMPKPAPGRKQPVAEQPWRREVVFGMPQVDTGGRRGLAQGDVVGAIRAPRLQPGLKIVFVDPHEEATRSGL